jgi:hypothetical protein
MIEEKNALSAFSRLNRTHKARAPGAENNRIETFHRS